MLGTDGWLHTGDIGRRSTRTASVTITDRKKDIIVTAGGKNVAPQNLENELKTSRFVSQALVVGDRPPLPAGADHARPRRVGSGRPSTGSPGDVAELSADDRAVAELVAGVVDDVNRERSRFEQIKRFTGPAA